jgi:hypothetical protein
MMASEMPGKCEWDARFQAAKSASMKRDFQTAAEEYKVAVELAEQFQLGDVGLARSLEGLAAAQWCIDKSDPCRLIRERASAIRDKILAIKEATLGPDHLEIAKCLDRCAHHRRTQNKPSDAIAFYQRAYEIRKSALGEVHVDVANTLTLMAGVYVLNLRDKISAAELWQRGISILEHLSDDPHSKTQPVATALQGNLHCLACFRFEQGDYSGAEVLFRRLDEVTKESFESELSMPRFSTPIYAKTLIRLQKYQEAKAVLDAATRHPKLDDLFKEADTELYQAMGGKGLEELPRDEGSSCSDQ